MSNIIYQTPEVTDYIQNKTTDKKLILFPTNKECPKCNETIEGDKGLGFEGKLIANYHPECLK
jgi:hypothetical protein